MSVFLESHSTLITTELLKSRNYNINIQIPLVSKSPYRLSTLSACPSCLWGPWRPCSHNLKLLPLLHEVSAELGGQLLVIWQQTRHLLLVQGRHLLLLSSLTRNLVLSSVSSESFLLTLLDSICFLDSTTTNFALSNLLTSEFDVSNFDFNAFLSGAKNRIQNIKNSCFPLLCNQNFFLKNSLYFLFFTSSAPCWFISVFCLQHSPRQMSLLFQS